MIDIHKESPVKHNQYDREKERDRDRETIKNWLTIMEDEKSRDLQSESTSWRYRRTNDIVPVWVWKPEKHEYSVVPIPRLAISRPEKSQYVSLSLKAGKNKCFRLKAVRQEEFPFIWGMVGLSDVFKLSVDWMRPTVTRKSNMFYSWNQIKC